MKNVGTIPLRITAISVLYGDGARADEAHTTYELISLRRGTNEGQLGATFKLTALKGGVDLGNAVGAELEPITRADFPTTSWRRCSSSSITIERGRSRACALPTTLARELRDGARAVDLVVVDLGLSLVAR